MPLATTDHSLGLRKQAIFEKKEEGRKKKEKKKEEEEGGKEGRREQRKLVRFLWCESQDTEF